MAAQPLTGSILREYWTNVPGSEIPVVLLFDPRYPDHPSTRMYLPSFEAPSNAGQNFGARFRGYIHPPVTGEYTFWLAAWEGAELYLSKDDQPEHKVQIAVAYHKESRDWDDEDVQKSSALALVGGRRYYIEALQRQRTGGDCLAVAWQGPGWGREVIPGEFLSPFKLKAKENQH